MKVLYEGEARHAVEMNVRKTAADAQDTLATLLMHVQKCVCILAVIGCY
jgi:hypothetical protein